MYYLIDITEEKEMNSPRFILISAEKYLRKKNNVVFLIRCKIFYIFSYVWAKWPKIEMNHSYIPSIFKCQFLSF